ncbi:hypothetical protein P5V15_006489 [Pogonomyrmex californicus]
MNCQHCVQTTEPGSSCRHQRFDTDRQSFVEGVRACQNPNRSFTAMVIGYESDMRFLYCVSYLESHGGSMFCAVASLFLMRRYINVSNILVKFDNTRPDPLHTYLGKCIKFTLRFYSVI